jgi:Nucleoside phosphorylase
LRCLCTQRLDFHAHRHPQRPAARTKRPARAACAAAALQHAGRSVWRGTLHGQSVVLALSGIGKVAAATTATALIERFGVARIVFTGVAGGVGAGVQVGDVVVAQDYVQHDMDASPLFAAGSCPAMAASAWPAMRRCLLCYWKLLTLVYQRLEAILA